VDRTLELTRTYKGHCKLSQARPHTPPQAHYLVPCDTDKPPKPLTSANDDPGGPNWRLLDANPIAERLAQRREAIESGNVSATMTKATGPEGLALLAKLVTLWGDPPKRAYRRDPMETSVAICAGIRAISHFVSQQANIDPATEAKAIESGITLPLITLPDDEISRGLQVNEWDVVNQSAGGLKVRRSGQSAQNIAVGEAIGIKFMGRSRWTIGVVRWITMLDDGGIEFGIQFLAPAARTVAVTPTTTTSGVVKVGLLLVESEQSETFDSLLTPPNTFADLREYEIEEEGKVAIVRATSLIEKTLRFELFHVSPS
jgi:cyclic-di-GMP-binding protein